MADEGNNEIIRNTNDEKVESPKCNNIKYKFIIYTNSLEHQSGHFYKAYRHLAGDGTYKLWNQTEYKKKSLDNK